MNSLERVLRSAMTAPGNRDRFRAAGLIAQMGDRVDLVDDWHSAFTRLQPIAKATIRQHPGQFLANVDDIVYRGSTSGTGGQHFVYFADSEWNRARLKARRSALREWGIHELTPIINVGSRLLPVRPGDMAMARAITSEFVDRLLHQLETTPAVIRGYPSRLCEIAAVLTRQNLPAVLGVICTGECLFDFQKALLERVFAVPVINEYGCQESGISGLTCPEAGRLHLDSDRCLYEIIDGQLVTTDLLNVVMPMVRYQCGDVIKLHDDPCPCGRSRKGCGATSSLTATLQGRVEEMIRTRQGKQYLGDVVMPALPGALHYRIIRGTTQTTLHVCPDSAEPQIDLQPLLDWTTTVFGVTAQISLGKAQSETIAKAAVMPSPSIQDCDVQTWIDRVTLGSWSAEFSHPKFPVGEARKAAQLLYDLVNPAVLLDVRPGFAHSGMSASSWTLLQQVCKSTITDRSADQMTARILLFACSFLWDDPSVDQIYRQAIQRLQPLQIQSLQAQLFQSHSEHPAHLDRLIPTLFLDTTTALAIWTDWLHDFSYCHSGKLISGKIDWQVDTFTIQHTLQAFESAIERARRSPSHIFRTLSPFISVLIGDLSFFAPQFAPWLLGYWFELLHQQPLPQSEWLEPPDSFAQAWLKWRQQLMQPSQQDALEELRAAARLPEEQERVVLEQGYGQLIRSQPLNPKDWLPILQHIGEPRNSPDIIDSGVIDIVSWQPILKALVKPLFDQNQPDLAYDCLRAVTTPSARISAFERLAAQGNHKQPVLYDLFPQDE